MNSADRKEDSWVNEGLSEVAAGLVGGGYNTVDLFLNSPDTQLTFWPELRARRCTTPRRSYSWATRWIGSEADKMR